MDLPKVLIYSRSMSGSRMQYNGFCRPEVLRKVLSDYGDIYFYSELDYRKISGGNIALMDFFDPEDTDLSVSKNPSRISRLKGLNPDIRIITTSDGGNIDTSSYYKAGADLVLNSSSLCPIADTLSKGYQSGTNYAALEIGVGGLGYHDMYPDKRDSQEIVRMMEREKKTQQDVDSIVDLLVDFVNNSSQS